MQARLVCLAALSAAVAIPAMAPGVSAAPARRIALAAPPGWAAPTHDLGRVADPRIGHLTVALARSPDRERAFAALRAAQDTPGSPEYHRWLTPQQLGAQFGASDDDLANVTAWLRGAGLEVARVGNARTFVEVRGTTASAEAAFAVQLHSYLVAGKPMRAPDRAPSVPAALAGLVRGVTGLTEVRPAPQFTRAPDTLGSDGSFNVGVSDFATIYDLAPVYAQSIDGTGEVVGIIGRSKVSPPDIITFAAREGVTLGAFSEIIPPGTGVDPGAPCGAPDCAFGASVDDQAEATLDVTRVTSIAPGAKVELIVSAGNTMGDDGITIALEYAVDQFGIAADANIITMSFGECEAILGAAEVASFDALYQQAAAQGQSVFVSSGDSGADGCEFAGSTPSASQSLGVNGLCTSAAATCVGGTQFADTAQPSKFWTATGSAKSYIPEGAWNQPLDSFGDPVTLATGGGVSQIIAKPSYQRAIGSAGDAFRFVPDVSFTSSGHDPYVVCMAAFSADCAVGSDGTFAFTGFSGTSAAAPSLAAVMALVDQKVGATQGAANPGFYALGATPANGVFHDVTVASSGVAGCSVATPSICNNSEPGASGLAGGLAGFQVETGFDAATGWGSVDVARLVASWTADGAPLLRVDPATVSVTAGSAAVIAATATGLGTSPVFACSDLPSEVTCEFTGSGAAVTLTLTTGAPQPIAAAGGLLAPTPGDRDGRALLLAMFAIAVALLRGRRSSPRTRAIAIALASYAVASCGGKSADHADAPIISDAPAAADAAIDAHPDAPPDAAPGDPGTPNGKYLVIVTASDATTGAHASANLELTVAP